MLKPEDVIPHLGSPGHYQPGRSARSLAITWFSAKNLPPIVEVTLSQASRFSGAELIDAFFEKKIELGDRLTPSQADLVAILGVPDGLAVMAVEGKVDESFGPFVLDWLSGASPASGKPRRLQPLATTLGIDPARTSELRYHCFTAPHRPSMKPTGIGPRLR